MQKKLERVLIVGKQNKIGLHMVRRLGTMLEDKVDVSLDLSTGVKLRNRGVSIKKYSGDMVITVGGDGTFLRAAHQTNLPILPIKIEGHGFLCTATFKDLTDNLKRIVNGDYKVTERMRLSCTKLQKKKIERYIDRIMHKTYPPAINEIAFARKRPSKVLEVEINIDDTLFTFGGDGVILSTPAGSTAYNASAGGSLIDPTLEVVSIIPLYPFYSKIKPMIVPASKKIEINVKGECALIIDGHAGDYMKEESTFLVQHGDPVKVVEIVDNNFYDKFKKEFL